MPVSWGEVLDKITILQIKHERITSEYARANVAKELALLLEVASDGMYSPSVSLHLTRLKIVNEELWEIEAAIRDCEAVGDFGVRFIRLARSIYRRNDQRATIKRKINALLGSVLVEEKSYAGWAAASTSECPR